MPQSSGNVLHAAMGVCTLTPRVLNMALALSL